MKLLGVDLGDRRVGFAITDEEERLAVPSGFATVRNLDQAVAAILAKTDEEETDLIVLGHPLNMDGRAGPKAKEAQKVRDKLVELGLAVEMWDERLTTSEATRLLKDAGLGRKLRKNLIDANSAQRLLESYLPHRKRTRGNHGG